MEQRRLASTDEKDAAEELRVKELEDKNSQLMERNEKLKEEVSSALADANGVRAEMTKTQSLKRAADTRPSSRE